MSLNSFAFPVTPRPLRGLRAAVVLAVFLSAAGVLAQTGTPRSAPPATGQQESPIPRYQGGSGATSAGQWERWDINAHFNGKAPITPQLNPGTASFGGLSSTGRLTTACIANPAAPSVVQYGAAGSTILSYLLVCHDSNGGVTAPSTATTIVNAAATLSAANYVLISWPAVTGCSSWDVLKGNTSTALATGVTGLFVNDTGQATAAYTAPARNSTCDIAGSGVATAAPAISGFSVNGMINVQAYGAKCDDSHDDTTAFNNAFAAAASLIGSNNVSSTVIAPSGVECKINSQLNIPYDVNVDFSGTTLDFGGLSSSGTAVNVGNGAIPFPRIERAWTVRLGTMIGPGQGTTSLGILLGGATGAGGGPTAGSFAHGVLENTQALQFGTAVKQGFNTFTYTVRDNHFYNNGVGFDEVTSATNCGENVTFQNNFFDHDTGVHVHFGLACFDDFLFVGNSFDDSQHAPFFNLQGGQRATFVGNHWENDGTYAGEIATSGNPDFLDITFPPQALTMISESFNEGTGAGGTPAGIPIAWDNASNSSAFTMHAEAINFSPSLSRNLIDCTNCTNPGGIAKLTYVGSFNTPCSRIGSNIPINSCTDSSGVKITGVATVGGLTANGNITMVGQNAVFTPYLDFNLIYSAAGTPVPTCNSGANHVTLCVSDSTACTSLTTYTSGGSTNCHLHCDGSNWKEDGFGC